MGMKDLSVFHIPARDSAEFPANVPGRSKWIDACRLYA
jgi:hypothetical protein